MLADRWDKLLAAVKMVECAQTPRFQQNARYQLKDKHWQMNPHDGATRFDNTEDLQLVIFDAVS
jgi:hypothetical protein